MKVLTYPGEQQLTCPHCNSVLLVDKGDIKVKNYWNNEGSYVYQCCVCNEPFSVKEKQNNMNETPYVLVQ